MPINAAIILLGFWAPWIETWGIGSRISTLEWLALEVSRTGLLRFTVATPVVIVIGALIAAKAAALRIWGTAYLGPATVISSQMKAGAVVADGPYRYVRNPLYLGLWGMVAALSFMMPPTGALISLTLLTIFLARLVLGEEAFLKIQLGEPYLDYLRAVPRLVPRIRTALPQARNKPQWLRAVLSELTPIGVFVALAFCSWTYDNRLMERVVLISFGLSLVVRALTPAVLVSSKPPQ
jgi:protein-S-isoprenylcysteine O-methyltransferase Ste14